jgi:hypothetical protein
MQQAHLRGEALRAGLRRGERLRRGEADLLLRR